MRPGGEDLRVVIVDDSAVIRMLVAGVLRREEGLVLAGAAADGSEALRVVEKARPDVVVLDIEMPVLDGFGALRELKEAWPQLPVIMFSTLTERGAAATFQALSEGADDYVTKPSSTEGPGGAFAAVREKLVPLVRSWGTIARERSASSPRLPASPPAAPVPGGDRAPAPPERPPLGGTAKTWDRPPVPPPPSLVTAVAIGTSTGGPNALAQIVPSLPADLPVPLVLVQHMPPIFTRMLAERLDSQSTISVHEAEPGMVARAGHLYIAAGGSHMVVSRSQHEVAIGLDDGPPENSCKPAVDVLFRSAVATWGPGVLGVVLTGMGQDGLVGARSIIAAGGSVIAQDEPTSVVWGMPGAVAKAGLASDIVALKDVAGTIVRRVRHGTPRKGQAPAEESRARVGRDDCRD